MLQYKRLKTTLPICSKSKYSIPCEIQNEQTTSWLLERFFSFLHIFFLLLDGTQNFFYTIKFLPRSCWLSSSSSLSRSCNDLSSSIRHCNFDISYERMLLKKRKMFDWVSFGSCTQLCHEITNNIYITCVEFHDIKHN